MAAAPRAAADTNGNAAPATRGRATHWPAGPRVRAFGPDRRAGGPAGNPHKGAKRRRVGGAGRRCVHGRFGCVVRFFCVILVLVCALVPVPPVSFYRIFTGTGTLPVLCTSTVYDVKRISFCPTRLYWLTVAVASSRGGRLSTGHLSFVRSTRRQPPRSMPGQRPVSGLVQSDGDRRPSRSTDGSQYPRSLRFAAWSSSAPLARGPGSRDVGVLLAQAASSSAQRQWLHSQGRKPSTRLAPAPCSTRGPS